MNPSDRRNLKHRIFNTPNDIGDLRTKDDIVISESIGFVVSSTARVLGQALARELSPFDVAPAQWTILLHLWGDEGINQREISKRVGVEEATVTRTVDRLVRDDLVVRKINNQNKRQYELYLTKKGRALKDDLIPVVQNLNRNVLKNLSPTEFAELVRLLRLIREAVEEV
jgi:DNA-binding MarR family transcriptional regulator